MNLRRTVLVFIIFGGCLLLLNLWVYFQPSEFEVQIGQLLRFGSPEWLSTIMWLTTDTIFSLAIGVLFYAIWQLWQKNYISALLLTSALCSLLLIDAMKSVLDRPRPILDQATLEPFIGTSFPSGHAFVSLLLPGVLVLIISSLYPTRNRGVCIALAIIYAVFIGWTRVFLQAHYISDVIGGYIVALIFLLVLGLLYRWLTQKYGRG